MSAPSTSRFRAAVVQAAPVIFDSEATIEKVRALTKRAAGRGAQLVVFPEAFVGGYPKGIEFSSRVGTRAADVPKWFRRYAAGAMEIPGPASTELGGIANACR